MYMNEIVINVYEAVPVLTKMLNVSGFAKKFLKKSGNWLYSKYKKSEFYSVVPGFNANDIALIESALKSASEYCSERMLKLPSECNDPDIYAAYIVKEVKELRSVISMVYICDNYCSFKLITMQMKIRGNFRGNGKPMRFNDRDINEINTGIKAVADMLSRIKLTL